MRTKLFFLRSVLLSIVITSQCISFAENVANFCSKNIKYDLNFRLTDRLVFSITETLDLNIYNFPLYTTIKANKSIYSLTKLKNES